MLAQNFKTAEELGITDIELESLIKVLGMLERGELNHIKQSGGLGSSYQTVLRRGLDPEAPMFLQMYSYAQENECGTVACLAGWANLISGGKAFSGLTSERLRDVENMIYFWPDQLTDLFMINYQSSARLNTTPEQAATNLRHYLTTGKSDWHAAVRG